MRGITLETLIKMLDSNIELNSYEIIDGTIYLHVESTKQGLQCPLCGAISTRVHSHYERSFQDLPIQGKKVVVIINNRKMFCDNPRCERTTFAESFAFLSHKSKKTNRLKDEIFNISNNMSSLAAQRLLRNGVAMVSKSTICLLLKKRNNH